jgi:Ca2+-binding RTX toxin-like protein
LYGDAQYHLGGNVVCGNDRLISGTGNDDMWGDIAYSGFTNELLDLTRVTTGQDVFVFSANNGNDTIHDFRQGEDKIELQGIGVDSFDTLMGELHLSQENANTVITFGSNTITIIGVTDMTAADFLFT